MKLVMGEEDDRD